MKRVLCAVGLAGVALAATSELNQRDAKSFLRPSRFRRDANEESREQAKDDRAKEPHAVLDMREEWEAFKDVLEALKTHEDEVDVLETCIADCRKADWKWGAGFSEDREKYLETGENRPTPCPKCCDVVPAFAYTSASTNSNSATKKVFQSCVAPKCEAGQWANAASGSCDDCPAGQTSAKGSACVACPDGQSSVEGGVCEDCNDNEFSISGGQCQACAAGESSSAGDAACRANQCTCDNGDAAIGASCTSDGAEVCDSCEDGYSLSNGACVENQCTCDNGDAATGADCTENNAENCASCGDGFELNADNACLRVTCDPGQHLESSFLGGSSCVDNVCRCDNGDGHTGLDCATHDEESCASCGDGYELIGGFCEEEAAAAATDRPEEESGCRIVPTDPAQPDTGRLEVEYNGVWGTVCNDEFDNNDAHVACVSMGYTSGSVVRARDVNSAAVGSKIWLDNLRCDGSESSLFDCARGPANQIVGKHNCGHSEDIGVSCHY